MEREPRRPLRPAIPLHADYGPAGLNGLDLDRPNHRRGTRISFNRYIPLGCMVIRAENRDPKRRESLSQTFSIGDML